MSAANYPDAVRFLHSSLDAKPSAQRRASAQAREEMSLVETLSPRAQRVRKWAVIVWLVSTAHIVTVGVIGIPWALAVLFGGYVLAALAGTLRLKRCREAAAGR